jgi:hypothetical protein
MEEKDHSEDVSTCNQRVGNNFSQTFPIHEVNKVLRIWSYYVKVLMTFGKFITHLRVLNGEAKVK